MWTILLIGYFLTWALIPRILLAKKPPVSTLAWLWAIILFPYVGPLFYFVFGVEGMTRKRIQSRAEFRRSKLDNPSLDEDGKQVSHLIEILSGGEQRTMIGLSRVNEFAPSTADEIALLTNAKSFYEALNQSISEAQHHAHIQFYTVRADKYGRALLDAVVAAAKRGVQIRVLADRVGSQSLDRDFFDPLIAAGGQFQFFRTLVPLKNRFSINLRNHRKLQSIDARLAFVGGMNLGREYAEEDPGIGGWHDIQMRLRGNITASLQDVFANDWYFATGEELVAPIYYQCHSEKGIYLTQAISGGPDLPQEPMPKSFALLLHAATKRVWLTTGYFVPDAFLLNALKICVVRGVDVRLLVSEKSDHPVLVRIGRSFYEELLQTGVRIFEYQKGMNHGKVMAIDGEWLMVGSANFDHRSMRLNFELNVLAKDPVRTAELENVILGYFEDSNEVTETQIRNKTFSQRMIEAALRPFAPLL